MIYYICTERMQYVFAGYLSGWGTALQSRFRLLSYAEFFSLKKLPHATYIFTDIERLLPSQRERAAEYWHHFQNTRTDVRLLNQPLQVRQRFSLLRQLYKAGVNRFDVYRLDEDRRPGRYPVFIRRANGHSGPESGLLSNSRELEEAERSLTSRIAVEDLLITEFCATPDPQGRFWKYSAFIFGGRIVPAHLFVADTWCVKAPLFVDEKIIAAEYTYVDSNPHEQILSKAAGIANIDYGRIDYGLVDGQVQIYEINTHPQVMGPVDNFSEQRQRARNLSAERLEAAYIALDTAAGSHAAIQPPPSMKKPDWIRPGVGYKLCRRTMKAIGRESLTPTVFNRFRKLKYFAAAKIQLARAPLVAIKSRMAGHGNRR